MTDAQSLRDYLRKPGFGGTDYGLTDEQLQAYAEAAKARVQGRRLSWHALARDAIKADHEESR